MRRIMATTGFVTNSSSQVCWFDPKLLENEEVQAFLRAYGIENGYVGSDLWGRSTCGSFVLTKEQREEVNKGMKYGFEYCAGVTLDPEDPSIVTIYGDEFDGDIAYELTKLLCRIQGKGVYDVPHTEYN